MSGWRVEDGWMGGWVGGWGSSVRATWNTHISNAFNSIRTRLPTFCSKSMCLPNILVQQTHTHTATQQEVLVVQPCSPIFFVTEVVVMLWLISLTWQDFRCKFCCCFRVWSCCVCPCSTSSYLILSSEPLQRRWSHESFLDIEEEVVLGPSETVF